MSLFLKVGDPQAWGTGFITTRTNPLYSLALSHSQCSQHPRVARLWEAAAAEQGRGR